MTDYNLPEGMTAAALRLVADNLESDGWESSRLVAGWADAIDPPEPESVVTDEVVERYAAERGYGGVDFAIAHRDLEAVERLGWLRDPHDVNWGEELNTLTEENFLLVEQNDELRKRLHDLESDADNPSPSDDMERVRAANRARITAGRTSFSGLDSDEPWPTDEQVEAAAIAMFDDASRSMTWSESNHQELWLERARIAIEAVAPPATDERLAMAEGLLRRTLGYVPLSTALHVTVRSHLRSLTDGAGDDDE